MLYLFGFAFVLVLFFMGLSISNKTKRQKQLLALRSNWGKPKDSHFNFSLIDLYNQHNNDVLFHQLSSQTLADIDFNALFQFIDRTTSNVGQQYLYNQLQKPTNNILALQQLDKQADFFALNNDVRAQAQQLLLPLNSYNAYFIPTLFNDNLLVKPWWQKWLGINVIAVIVMLFLAPIFKVLLLWLMVPLSINMFLHFFTRNGSHRVMQSIPQFYLLLKSAKQLQAIDIPFEKVTISNHIKAFKKFEKSFLLQNTGQTKGDEFTQVLLLLVDLVKAFFLVEVRAFYKLMGELQNHQTEMRQLFNFVGSIDMAISIASVRQSEYKICKPIFLDTEKVLRVQHMYHPLIQQCVENSIDINNKSILITGSNMSGKSSFLRTVAINSILAQTIYTCFAETFETPILKLQSSIRIDDSLLDGKSYYFEEVLVMQHLINEVNNNYQNLFILDEVFKGTNTIERVAAAKAILSYLTQNDNIVIVATHDIELSNLLTESFDLYHFSEDIKNDKLLFDHLLKVGALRTRNAIKILELSNYPKAIITEAKALANVMLNE